MNDSDVTANANRSNQSVVNEDVDNARHEKRGREVSVAMEQSIAMRQSPKKQKLGQGDSLGMDGQIATDRLSCGDIDFHNETVDNSARKGDRTKCMDTQKQSHIQAPHTPLHAFNEKCDEHQELSALESEVPPHDAQLLSMLEKVHAYKKIKLRKICSSIRGRSTYGTRGTIAFDNERATAAMGEVNISRTTNEHNGKATASMPIVERWSESQIDNATSLPQLEGIRHRLKMLLERVENKINDELVKKALEVFDSSDIKDGAWDIGCGGGGGKMVENANENNINSTNLCENPSKSEPAKHLEREECCRLCLSTDNAVTANGSTQLQPQIILPCSICDQSNLCKNCKTICRICRRICCLDCLMGCEGCGSGSFCTDCGGYGVGSTGAGIRGGACVDVGNNVFVMTGGGLCQKCVLASLSASSGKMNRRSCHEAVKRVRTILREKLLADEKANEEKADGNDREKTARKKRKITKNDQMLQQSQEILARGKSQKRRLPNSKNANDYSSACAKSNSEHAPVSLVSHANQQSAAMNSLQSVHPTSNAVAPPVFTSVSSAPTASALAPATVHVPNPLQNKESLQQWDPNAAHDNNILNHSGNNLQLILKYTGPEQHPFTPPNVDRHKFLIQEEGPIGITITEASYDSRFTVICDVKPRSFASAYGLQKDDVVVPPVLHLPPGMLSKVQPSHMLTRGWFLEHIKKRPTSFYVYRRQGGDSDIDKALTNIFPSRTFRYSIHRFVIHHRGPLGITIGERVFGLHKLSYVGTVEPNSLGEKHGIKKLDIILRPTTCGRHLLNVHEWIRRKIRSDERPFLFEVIRPLNSRDDGRRNSPLRSSPSLENPNKNFAWLQNVAIKEGGDTLANNMVGFQPFQTTSPSPFHAMNENNDLNSLRHFHHLASSKAEMEREPRGGATSSTHYVVDLTNDSEKSFPTDENHISLNNVEQVSNTESVNNATRESDTDNTDTVYRRGTEVRKVFEYAKGKSRPFSGVVEDYDPEEKLYKIVYEDGDSEELTKEEVAKILITNVKRSDKKSRRTKTRHAKPSSTELQMPFLAGTLSYSDRDGKRTHIIRGVWVFENLVGSTPQRFELVRNICPEEELEELPKDGEFHGSFVYEYHVGTSKLKMSTIIQEREVKLAFIEKEGDRKSFHVKGTGVNKFGVFELIGTATKSAKEDDPSYNVQLRKHYIKSCPALVTQTETVDAEKESNNNLRKFSDFDSTRVSEEANGKLPPPSKSYPTGVICLRGTLSCHASEDSGLSVVIQKIAGLWSSGLDVILEDPENNYGLCDEFEYEHRSAGYHEQSTLPLSGRFTGWFSIKNGDQSMTKVEEHNLVLNFQQNNEGYHNVEGGGSNDFGRYTISGTLTSDGVITIFRHFYVPESNASHVDTSTSASYHLNKTADHK